MAELFQVDKSGVSRHLDNIYETGELIQESTVATFATVQKEGGLLDLARHTRVKLVNND
jgi:hypothetical protein